MPVSGRSANEGQELVNTRWLEDRVVVTRDIAFVRDFDEHVRIAAREQPVRRCACAANYCRLVFQPLVLSKVEVADDGDHAERVGQIENPSEPIQICGAQRTVGLEGGVVPGLFLGIALGTAALQVQRET